MSKYLVYKDMKSKKLVYLYEEEGWEFVGVFTADATCDFIMNMIKMNERAGNIDEHWNELSKQIDKEGI